MPGVLRLFSRLFPVYEAKQWAIASSAISPVTPAKPGLKLGFKPGPNPGQNP